MNHKRKRARVRVRYRSKSMSSWPAWWDILFHRRPKRRAEKHVMDMLRHGADPDGLMWPLGSHKPHKYFW
jgi:hypothetical protein